jgi:hypothetical protein
MVSSSSFKVNSPGLLVDDRSKVLDGVSSSDDDPLPLDSLELCLSRRRAVAICCSEIASSPRDVTGNEVVEFNRIRSSRSIYDEVGSGMEVRKSIPGAMI